MERRQGGDGISEVLGFVIILAVVMAALSLYIGYGVPVLGREGEIREMDAVRGWFVDYKTGVDQLWLNSAFVPKTDDPDNSRNGTGLFNATIGQVTLRRVINPMTAKEPGFFERYLPVFAPIRSSGEVSVRKDENITLSATRDGVPAFEPKRFNATAVAYRSHNNYWLQQEYYYQMGGVFLRQWDQREGPGSATITVVASPPLSIFNTNETLSGDVVKVEMVVVNLNAETSGVSSTSPIRLATRLDTDPFYLDDTDGLRSDEYSDVTLTFYGSSIESARAWAEVFNGSAKRQGGPDMEYGTHFTVVRPSDKVAQITVTGRHDKDVLLEVLDARCSMRMENVPTVIE